MEDKTNVVKKRKSRTKQYRFYIGTHFIDEFSDEYICDVKTFSGNKSSALLFINKYYAKQQLKYPSNSSYSTVINFYELTEDDSIVDEMGWKTIDELIESNVLGV